MIALIAVSVAVYAMDKPYSYRVPGDMTLCPGMRVIVPFGQGNRRCEGMVLAIQDGDKEGLKAVERTLDDTPVLSEQAVRLAVFVRERYFCTFYDAIRAMLPAGHWFDASVAVTLTDPAADHTALIKRQPNALLLVQQLQAMGGNAELSELRKQLPADFPLDKTLQYLIRKELARSSADFSKRTRDRTEQIAYLARPAEETMEFAQRKQRSAIQQYNVLKLLCAIGSGSTKEICYLTGASMATIRRLEELGYLQLHAQEVFRCPLPEHVTPAKPFVLNEEQQAAYDGLLCQAQLPAPGVSLLFGVTGSGKTAVYIRLIQSMLELGRSAILLVPEISLTPQLISLLMSHFGEKVAVLHSALRVTERYDEWKRIRAGKAKVVIGTRSAIFAPVQDPGVIIVDEEQEHTYKSENAPRYHAREIAIYRGSREQALVVLGSATPSLETMYHAENGQYTLHRLQDRFNGKQLPKVQLVDMKQELRSGNGSCISKPLQNAIRANLSATRQSILFLNRRGAGRCLICVDCGDVPTCPRCSVSLTYHAANNRLMCHYCGHSEPLTDRCPECGGHLKIVGSGTQKVQQELETLFPDTPILRMDADTITARNTHEDILRRFQEEKIPILIGTQMVTKGLNFENVTLVGVVDADMSLYVDHYRAAENTFSMITQVVGRSGRGAYAGRALIQTMTPEHAVLQLAAVQDYDRFYRQEITLRQLHGCPPFGDLISVFLLGLYENITYAAACQLKNLIIHALRAPEYAGLQISILGPAPATIAKINNTYRYRIVIRCSNQRPLRQLLAWCLRTFAKDKHSKGITAYVDVNSYE